MNRIFNILFLLLFFAETGYSQRIENVDFTMKDNLLIVTYDLVNCPSRELYDVKLTFKSDNGTIEPKTITGDLRKVSSGRNKRIEWDVLKDKEELKGNIQAIVEVTHTYSTKKEKIHVTGGPSNVFLSMLFPGLGSIIVNEESRAVYGLYTMIFYAGTVYVAVASKIDSDDYYKQYHAATTQSEMDDTYENANTSYQLFLLASGVASTIWIADVLHVTVKGFKNRREQLRYAQNSSMPKFYFSFAPNNYKIGLVKTF